MKNVQTLFKAGSEAIKEGATVKDVIKYTLKPKVGAVLGSTLTRLPLSLLKCGITKTTHLHLIHQSSCLSLSRRVQIKRGAVDLYIRRHLNVPSNHPNSDQLFIIFKMAINKRDVTKQITSNVNLFGSIMKLNVIKNEVNREYVPLATIQPGMAIKFTVKGANDLYLDLNNSRLHVLAKITKAVGNNIDANIAAPINLTLHSMFREIELELNGRNVGDTTQLYLYRSHLESLLNFCKKTQETRLLCEGWT